jgi:hypothetical protein
VESPRGGAGELIAAIVECLPGSDYLAILNEGDIRIGYGVAERVGHSAMNDNRAQRRGDKQQACRKQGYAARPRSFQHSSPPFPSERGY